MAGMYTSCGPTGETAETSMPLKIVAAQGVKWGRQWSALSGWQLVFNNTRSKVWGPKRRSTCSQALFDNLHSVSDTFLEGKAAGFTWRSIMHVKANSEFSAAINNVLEDAVNFKTKLSVCTFTLLELIRCLNERNECSWAQARERLFPIITKGNQCWRCLPWF